MQSLMNFGWIGTGYCSPSQDLAYKTVPILVSIIIIIVILKIAKKEFIKTSLNQKVDGATKILLIVLFTFFWAVIYIFSGCQIYPRLF
jgi:hypothetical protein